MVKMKGDNELFLYGCVFIGLIWFRKEKNMYFGDCKILKLEEIS